MREVLLKFFGIKVEKVQSFKIIPFKGLPILRKKPVVVGERSLYEG
jgi:hypothetical protein